MLYSGDSWIIWVSWFIYTCKSYTVLIKLIINAFILYSCHSLLRNKRSIQKFSHEISLNKLQSSSKVLGRLLLFTCFFPSFSRPCPDVEQNVNVWVRNCSHFCYIPTLNRGDGRYLAKEKILFFED